MKVPVAVGLLLSTAACTSLQPVLEPSLFIATKQPAFVVVTTVESDEIDDPLVFLNPTIKGDLLAGSLDGQRQTLPLVRIKTLRATQPDRRKTALAVAGGVLVAGAFGFLVAGGIGDRIDNGGEMCVPPHCDM